MPTQPGLTTRLRAAWRHVGPLHWLVAALAVAHVVPLWLVEYVPFMDLPQHMAAIGVLAHHGDPALGYAAYFYVDLWSTPYLGFYLVAALFAQIVSVETAVRLFLSLYVLLMPLAAWRYLRAHGRDPLVTLLVFPVIYGTFVFMGFVNFVVALPFLLLGLGALRRSLDGDRRAQIWLVVHSLALYFTHTQVYLLYVGSAGLYLLLVWPGWRRFFFSLLHLIPTLVLFGVWVVGSAVLATGEAWTQGHGGRNASPPGASWEDIGTTLRELPARLVDAYRDGSDDVLLVLLGLVIVGLLIARRPPSAEGARAWLRTNALEVVTLVLLGLYFALPVSFKWIWPLNWRLVPVAYLVGLAALRLPPMRGRWRAALAVPLALLAVVGVVNHAKHFKAFQAEVGPLNEVLQQAEPRRRTMGLIFDKGSGIITPTLAPYLHYAQFYQLRRGGMADFSFANFAQSPVHFYEETGPPHLPVRWEWTPERMRYPDHPPGAADYYDYYLVRGSWRGRGPFAKHLGTEIREVASAGRWRLFERIPTTP